MSALLAPETLARLERLVVLARRAPPPRRRGAPHAGRGVEVGSRRDYAAGDDVRLVDWPAFARLERLLVKVVEALPEPRLELLLDGSASMARGVPAPAERAALAAAALAAAATAREVRVGVWWAGPAAEVRTALTRPGELVRLLRFLAARTPAGAGRLPEAAARLALAARGRGRAVVLTDGLEPAACAEAARRLAAAGFDAQVVVAAPDAEVDDAAAHAAAEAGLAVLVDAETGARREAPFALAALDAARAARADRRRALAADLAASGLDVDVLLAADPFEAVARGLLGRPSPGGGPQ